MPGTPNCAWCGSHDTQAGFDLVQCLGCGLHTSMDGEKAVPSSQANEGVTVADIPAPTEPAPEPTPEPVEIPEEVSADE